TPRGRLRTPARTGRRADGSSSLRFWTWALSAAGCVLSSQDVTGEILVLDDVVQHAPDVCIVDRDGRAGEFRSLERDLVEQLLHHGVQPAGANVFRPLVDARGEVSNSI